MTLSQELNHQLGVLSDRWKKTFSGIPKSYFKFLLTKEGRYIAFEVPDVRRLQKPPEEHIGKLLEEVLRPEWLVKRRFFFDLAVQTGEKQVYSYPHPLKEGRFFECTIDPSPDSDEVLMLVRDVTVSPVPDDFVCFAEPTK